MVLLTRSFSITLTQTSKPVIYKFHNSQEPKEFFSLSVLGIYSVFAFRSRFMSESQDPYG